MARSRNQTQTPVTVTDVTTSPDPEVEAAIAEASEIVTEAAEDEVESKTARITRKRQTLVKVLFHVRVDLDAWEAGIGEIPGDSELRVQIKDAANAHVSQFSFGPEGVTEVVA
jgi:2',3'-cyclic-nucleotide 2'-phosphodiesterase (5'-nucleotidase family)